MLSRISNLIFNLNCLYERVVDMETNLPENFRDCFFDWHKTVVDLLIEQRDRLSDRLNIFFRLKRMISETTQLLPQKKSIFETLVEISTKIVEEQIIKEQIDSQEKEIIIKWYTDKLIKEHFKLLDY